MAESPTHSIGWVSRHLGMSVDTLRYYERIGLLPPVLRSASGRRCYGRKDLSRLRFIRRAQAMGFSLDEIAQLLRMREDPLHARDEVRRLTLSKLQETEARLQEITTLRNELQLLVNLCQGTADGCPIVERIDEEQE
ncbi:MAG TPA: heavy metal-responsive transcriptional regulator [Sedimenticola thiotaurini]|uniref:Heavy metal-responsive transcriptional regulator n=1 Tax=Sedimenticola thiotaurini TaxID=1543721 RepID=A0A831RK78_9GAMM|nr:heavy metal-responsive transcriptional regulator [Sedimenticola thiotaurini]